MIGAALISKAWAAAVAWVSPWAVTTLGPWLARAAPLIARVPTFATIKIWLRVTSYVVVLGCGVWLGVQVLSWWRGDMISQRLANQQAKTKCDDTIARANIAARERALQEREAALLARETDVAADAKAVAQFEQELEAARANLENGSAAVISADDEWLRKWTKRK
jgi:hypothetical protein